MTNPINTIMGAQSIMASLWIVYNDVNCENFKILENYKQCPCLDKLLANTLKSLRISTRLPAIFYPLTCNSILETQP